MDFAPKHSEFSGISGQVLHRSVSASSLISGFVLSFVIFVSAWVMTMAEVPGAITPVTQIVIALALARFAVNGLFGEWSGTIFSTRGGSWGAVALVSMRYLVLTAMWLVPLLLLSPGGEQIASVMAMGPSAAGKLAVFFGLYLLAATLTPPVFLIVAARADSFGAMFSKQLWRDLFRGRLGDLFMIYAVYTGGVGMVLVLSIPFVIVGFVAGKPPGFILAFAAFCMLMGLSANLLGRLCGFFACGELDSQMPVRAGLDAAPSRPAPTSVATATSASTATPGSEHRHGGPAPAAISAESAPISPAAGAASHGVAQATAMMAAVEPEAAPKDKRPPLLEAGERVDALMKRWDKEPQTVLAALKDLWESYAATPQVMQGYCICLNRAGQTEEAQQLARQALAMCFERGNSHLAAKIFSEFRASVDALKMSRDQTLTIATSLYKMDDLAMASKAFSLVLSADPGDVRAVKGLLQVADDILQNRNKPEAAERIFAYLLKHCSASPLAEYMRRGLDEAQRRRR